MTALPSSGIPVIIIEEMVKIENHYAANITIITVFR